LKPLRTRQIIQYYLVFLIEPVDVSYMNINVCFFEFRRAFSIYNYLKKNICVGTSSDKMGIFYPKSVDSR
jgi:hypothetical protein